MYFEKYDFMEDVNSKSISYKFKEKKSFFNKKILDELIYIGQKENKLVRVCLHNDDNDDLQSMIIYVPKSYNPIIHMHKDKTETYHLLKGKCTIAYFSTNGENTENIELSKYNMICRVPSNTYHAVIPFEMDIVFHESITGPYNPDDTIIPEWFNKLK